MRTRLHDFDYDCPLSILIGENGSGKSQALADIAEAYISKNRTVIAIANCPFDKFRDKGKRYFFMGGCIPAPVNEDLHEQIKALEREIYG